MHFSSLLSINFFEFKKKNKEIYTSSKKDVIPSPVMSVLEHLTQISLSFLYEDMIMTQVQLDIESKHCLKKELWEGKKPDFKIIFKTENFHGKIFTNHSNGILWLEK